MLMGCTITQHRSSASGYSKKNGRFSIFVLLEVVLHFICATFIVHSALTAAK
jgi:hypothetical protein